MIKFIEIKDTFEKPKYNGEKVNCLLKSLRKKDIKIRMSFERQNLIELFNNHFKIHGFVTNEQFKIIYKFWFNFVINDYLDPKRLENN